MFKDNKYTRWYNELIKKAFNREKHLNAHYENHHIIPKSLGGSDDKTNIVSLTYKEHYIAHLLLTKMVISKDHFIKMSWALHRMTFSRSTSRSYEANRTRWSKFLKETFHPQRNQDLDYREKLSIAIEKSWQNDECRRIKTSNEMKEYHKNKKAEDLNSYLIEQKRRAINGAQKAKEKVSKRIIYNGNEYLGWLELETKTGLSKHLYNRFYVNGIDPSFRIGKNGPMNIDDIKNVVNQYCHLINRHYPITIQDAISICENACLIGLLTTNQSKTFIETFKGKESSR